MASGSGAIGPAGAVGSEAAGGASSFFFLAHAGDASDAPRNPSATTRTDLDRRCEMMRAGDVQEEGNDERGMLESSLVVRVFTFDADQTNRALFGKRTRSASSAIIGDSRIV